MPDNMDLQERERIRYQWMLTRIQGMKSLLVAIILAMVGYSTSAIGQSATYFEIILLSLSALSLVIALALAAIDAGAALFYNEKSQEGLSKKLRIAMYILIALAALLILSAKVTLGITNVKKQHQATVQLEPQNLPASEYRSVTTSGPGDRRR